MKFIMVNKSGGFDVPVGSVILWYGISSNIPDGYEIYTELKGYFPLGGATVDLVARGSEVHSHSYPSDALAWQGDHQHNTVGNISGTAGSVGPLGWFSSTDAAPANHSHSASSNPTGAAGGHRHTLGNTGNANHLNSYYKLYYIRRIA